MSDKNSGSFWSSAPGILTGIAAVITAIGGLYAVSGGTPDDNKCLKLKGNISSSGEKIYHAPGDKDYEQTVIDKGNGERFFCTEMEAVENGWRKAPR